MKKFILQNFIAPIVNKVAQGNVCEIEDGMMSTDEAKALCRQAAAEACVLLKNDGVLPIGNGEISVFGRCQFNYFFCGYGSGGYVKAPYKISPAEAFLAKGANMNAELLATYRSWISKHPPYDGFWGFWPLYYDEMPVDKQLTAKCAQTSDTAVIFIGRSSGEDREAKLQRGSWYLTKHEETMIKNVTAVFKKVCVILNCGAIMDMSWVDKYHVGAVLYAWQGGQESGNALYDVLFGAVSPCGKLADTIAAYESYPNIHDFGKRRYCNYIEDIYVGYRYFETFAPEKIIYPFGFGLSYTRFEIQLDSFDADDKGCKIVLTVKNIGICTGKEVVQAYCGAPQGKLGKPNRQLVAFAKTKCLEANEVQQLTLHFAWADIASYDDIGASGDKNAYVLEAGEYLVFAGSDSHSATLCGRYHLQYSVVRKTCVACPPQKPFDRLVNRGGRAVLEQVPAEKTDMRERILRQIPDNIEYAGDKGYKLSDVKKKVISLEEFIAQLDEDDLEALCRGSLDGMCSPQGVAGNAGVFGGTNDSLKQKGVPVISTNDGPSGLRLQSHATLIPIGTALACTFDVRLVEELLACIGEEMAERKSDVLLAPGMNIHRNPLCGRNFEYFSEDPVLSGKIAAAYVRGFQRFGKSAAPKHFACNNQETNRLHHDARISQRALREIYLKPFAICIREADPHMIMASYNKLNGIYNCYNYDLCTEILRNEFGFQGCVMTDWWMVNDRSADFANIAQQAYRVRAQVDIFMPGSSKTGPNKGRSDGTLLASLHSKDGIMLGELQRSAANVLQFCLNYI